MTDDASAMGAERGDAPGGEAEDASGGEAENASDGDGEEVTAAIRRVEDASEPVGSDEVTAAIRRIEDATDTAGDAGAGRESDAAGADAPPGGPADDSLPEDVAEYARFSKIDGATYDRANEFLRERTYITAREWAMARLCADFRTETGVEMTKIGENLPHLVPFMTDTYSPQAVNQARASFEEKVQKAGATFLYGAMCDFFTAEELDDLMYEVTEVAKFLLEVEGVELTVEEELAAEDRISTVMREVREQSAALRHDEMQCPECGHTIGDHD